MIGPLEILFGFLASFMVASLVEGVREGLEYQRGQQAYAEQLWEGISEPSPWEANSLPIPKTVDDYYEDVDLAAAERMLMQTPDLTPLRTPAGTGERTPTGTGVTPESLVERVVEVVESTGGEGGGADAGGAVEQFKSSVLPAPKNGYELNEESVLSRGTAYYLLQSALLIDPEMMALSQNWFLREVFKISKNTKAHELFKQLLQKVKGDLNV